MEIISTSYHLGEKKINLTDKYKDIERLVNKTGIKSVWETNDDILSLAEKACAKIIDEKWKNKINVFILVTQSPHYFLPANSIVIANRLGLSNTIFTFDFNQGCSGFVQAFIVMSHLIKQYKTGLIVTADCYRKKLDPEDRSTNSVFSDGAAAILLKNNKNKKILFENTITDGSKRKWLYQSTNGENNNFLHMSGSEIWIFTLRKVVPQIKESIEYCEKNLLKISGIYIHQASKLVVEGIKNSLGKNNKLVFENYMKFGNTVSSTIPILLNEYPINTRAGVSIMAGFGVGLTSSVIVYG